MNKKLLAVAFCVFLNTSVWACESDGELDSELANINSKKNLTNIAVLSERLSRFSTGFQSASCNENNGTFRTISRIQSFVTPEKQSEKLHEETAKKQAHRQRLGSLTNTGMAAMDTSGQKNRVRRKSTTLENCTPELEEICAQENSAPVVIIKPRSKSSLSDRERRSASRLAYYSNHRPGLDDNSDNNENYFNPILKK